MLHKLDEICKGKIKYSRKEAKNKRVYNMRFRNPDLRIYECPICFHWHLTSSIIYDIDEGKRKYPAKKMRKKRFQFIPTMSIDSD